MSVINYYVLVELYDNFVLLFINGLGFLIEIGDIGEGKIFLYLWDFILIFSVVLFSL